MYLEGAVGRALLMALGLCSCVSARASDGIFAVYNLNSAEFESKASNGRLHQARDSEEFRNFLQVKYNLNSISNEQLSELVTVEDFEAYRGESILWTARTSGNPTCICD